MRRSWLVAFGIAAAGGAAVWAWRGTSSRPPVTDSGSANAETPRGSGGSERAPTDDEVPAPSVTPSVGSTARGLEDDPTPGGSRVPSVDIDAAFGDAFDIDARDAANQANSNLAPTPSREDFVAAFASIAPAVGACTDRVTRVVPVRVVFGHDGNVIRAEPVAYYGGGPMTDCVVRAVRNAHVPPFRSPTVSLVYPFVFE